MSCFYGCLHPPICELVQLVIGRLILQHQPTVVPCRNFYRIAPTRFCQPRRRRRPPSSPLQKSEEFSKSIFSEGGTVSNRMYQWKANDALFCYAEGRRVLAICILHLLSDGYDAANQEETAVVVVVCGCGCPVD